MSSSPINNLYSPSLIPPQTLVQQTLTEPKIMVFDTFDNNTEDQCLSQGFDYNQDGIRDRSHGDVIADIIQAQTGYSAHKISVPEFGREKDIKNGLRPLLQSDNLNGTYINLSISWGNDPETTSLILNLANKGAKFYIAAGNDDINNSASKELGQHENIFIVAA